MAHTEPTPVPLVDLDPDLASSVPPEQLQSVRRAVLVTVETVSPGSRRAAALDGPGGFLVLEGLVLGRVAVAGALGAEPLGPGDIALPPTSELDGGPLSTQPSWSLAGSARIAVFPESLPSVLARAPGLAHCFLERQHRQLERARLLQAIVNVTRVDVRVLALLWHLAGRWGRVTPQGVSVRLALTHRMLAELVGARRPTVTTALGQLEERHALTRRPPDEWLLHGAPPTTGRPDELDLVAAG
jgi:hypothetical protein